MVTRDATTKQTWATLTVTTGGSADTVTFVFTNTPNSVLISNEISGQNASPSGLRTSIWNDFGNELVWRDRSYLHHDKRQRHGYRLRRGECEYQLRGRGSFTLPFGQYAGGSHALGGLRVPDRDCHWDLYAYDDGGNLNGGIGFDSSGEIVVRLFISKGMGRKFARKAMRGPQNMLQ